MGAVLGTQHYCEVLCEGWDPIKPIDTHALPRDWISRYLLEPHCLAQVLRAP